MNGFSKILVLSSWLIFGCGDPPLVVPILDVQGSNQDIALTDSLDSFGTEDLLVLQDLFVALPDLSVQDTSVLDQGTDSTAKLDESANGLDEGSTVVPCPLTSCVQSSVSDEFGCTVIYKDKGTPCDDDDLTTRDDECNELGVCNGTAYTCDEANVCITEYQQDGDGCLPQMAPAGTQCTDDNPETVEDVCDGEGACSGVVPCFDLDLEPNDGQSSAISLGTIGDCDGDGGSITGVLNGSDDQDWFSFVGEDGFMCSAGPALSFQNSPGIEGCVFISCINEPNSSSVECEEGEPATAPSGALGCCSSGPVKLKPDCSGWSDDVNTFIRIKRIPANGSTCAPYTFQYNY